MKQRAADRPQTQVVRMPWDGAVISRLRKALQDGAVMAYPTETSYALGGNALIPEVAEAVYALKGRPEDKALLLLIDGSDGLVGWVREVTPVARVLMDRFWPGPLTLIFAAGEHLPPHLQDARGTVALRWSPHPQLAALHRVARVPLIGTSANRAGDPSAHTAEAVLAAFPTGVELMLDGGRTSGGEASTLVDTTISPPRLLREGPVPRVALQAALPQVSWA